MRNYSLWRRTSQEYCSSLYPTEAVQNKTQTAIKSALSHQLRVTGAVQDNLEVFQETSQTQPPGHTGWGLLQRQANLVLQLLAPYF